MRACPPRIRVRAVRAGDSLRCSGSYTRTRMGVRHDWPDRSMRGFAACSEVEQRRVASPGFGRETASGRSPSGARRESRPLAGAFRRPEPRGFGRAGGSRELVDSRRRRRSGSSRSARRRAGPRSSDGDPGRGRGLRTAISRIRQTAVHQASVPRGSVCRERHGGSPHRVGCVSRRSRGDAAETSEHDFGRASESSRLCAVQGDLG